MRDDADRQRRLDWLRRTTEVYGWRLHTFVLMSNHDHLFVETPEANLSAGMQHDNGRYPNSSRCVTARTWRRSPRRWPRTSGWSPAVGPWGGEATMPPARGPHTWCGVGSAIRLVNQPPC